MLRYFRARLIIFMVMVKIFKVKFMQKRQEKINGNR